MPQRSTHHRPNPHRNHHALAAGAAAAGAGAAVGISGPFEASIHLRVQASK